ncbi:thiamine pyrophosphate-requiring protein [Bordetella bronchiseptica]|uniref:thiamine pyrophosphate-requiring protein n=1 Tax=Bordetella bronchiseptica TaxID=518 RepID=UPI0004A180E5|nr:thiamine pyrophosphate-requiring protein [Bordetella bronchiseptica]KDC75322.1 thiamine pyrophosphate enzyme, N-terminal TPP binding domain protein [Bordetella bronchiseptica MBORD632]
MNACLPAEAPLADPDPLDPDRKAVDEVARILKAEHTELLFCFPINSLIDAATAAGIRPVVARTERAVVGMADGYARASLGERVGVCAVQYGPGCENGFGAMAQAYSDSSPVLMLPGGVNESRTDVRPNFETAKHYGNITKWVARVNRPDRVGEMMRRAYTGLRNGRRGPVALELPMDVMEQPVGRSASRHAPSQAIRTLCDPDTVRAACRLLLAAERPVLHAGAGVLQSGATPELVELAELLSIPTMTTLSGKSGFPERHPLALGSGGMAWPATVAHGLRTADLLFGVGASLTKSVFAAPLPAGRRAMQLAVDDSDLNKDYPLDHALLGDARLVLRQMIDMLKNEFGVQPDPARTARTGGELEAIRQAWLRQWHDKLTSASRPINPYRVVHDLQIAWADRDVIITHDAGSPRDQLSPFYRCRRPGEYLGWGRSTHLGYSLPLALGAKMARPDALVAHLLGDAAFGECAMDLETAVRNRIGTVTVLMNNGCMGGYDKHMPLSSTTHRTRFLSGDYEMIARGLGAWTERVEDPARLVEALREAARVADTGRPAVLEIMTAEEKALSQEAP